MDNTLCNFVLHLYKGSREQATTRFTGWALDQARAMIHFDSALWAIGTPGERIHSAHYYQLPGTMLREWERRRKDDSELNPLVEGRLNEPVRLDNLISVAGTAMPPPPPRSLKALLTFWHPTCIVHRDRGHGVKAPSFHLLLSQRLGEAIQRKR